MIFDRLFNKNQTIPSPDRALPGRPEPVFEIPDTHAVLGTRIQPPFPEGMEAATFGLGCFWGAERIFWQADGVYSTAVGYAGGITPNPTYEEVCTGQTGHAEVVLVVFDPKKVTYEALVKTFFEAHDPTQGMRQGNDVGTQYRSVIYVENDRQRTIGEAAKASYNASLQKAGYPEITTEIAEAGPFYYAEEYHQQYLHKVPSGYCGIGGTGVTCAMPRTLEATPRPAAAPAPVSGGDHVPDGESAGPATQDPGLKPLPASEDEWRKLLGPEQYRVLRQAGTERPFTGEYNAVFEEGTYRCAACGNPLFDSSVKFD
ncbi:MAG TPA: peptide-methionine (S)-S-oxide reductase MsrA, partial [Thermomicrobiales bacterium]|nr:peptide-methionine (S)-S-oxide reductase MsrA [Thermomicrobiales bacterium]